MICIVVLDGVVVGLDPTLLTVGHVGGIGCGELIADDGVASGFREDGSFVVDCRSVNGSVDSGGLCLISDSAEIVGLCKGDGGAQCKTKNH